jgi:hypothetical protein
MFFTPGRVGRCQAPRKTTSNLGWFFLYAQYKKYLSHQQTVIFIKLKIKQKVRRMDIPLKYHDLAVHSAERNGSL